MATYGYDTDAMRQAAFEQGLSANALAIRADLAPATAMKALLGGRVTPRTVRKLAEALGLELKDLVIETAAETA